MMNQKKLRSLAPLTLFVCLLLGSLPSAGLAQRQAQTRLNPARAASASTAKLVLVIMIDQFRYDFIERFWDLYGNDGFRRLVSDGAFFTNANFDYVPTVTAAGHAAVHTGSIPALNGINGNYMVDRETGRLSALVADKEAHLVTNAGLDEKVTSASPRVMTGTTIGDQIRLSNNFQSKVIALSQKDRAAILPGGQRPNGAFWFNNTSGSFVSSDYYFKELPAWVKQFNTSSRPDKYFGAKWERALPAEAYRRAMQEHMPEQQRVAGEDFPYTINGREDKPGPKFYQIFEFTPFVSEYLESFAKAAIEGESLGADQYTDLLSVSFSAPDLVGHSYGPDSQEVEDVFIRLDRVIADLLNYVDRRVGLANTLVAMTADHGVSPIPKRMEMLGLDASVIDRKKLDDAVNQALKARFGGDKWVLTFANEQLYLSRKLMEETKADPAEVERIAGEAALTVKGIANYFTRTQIIEGRMPAGGLSRRVMNGFYRPRAGDVWIITKPFSFVFEGVSLATTHGSPYRYDTHVPVIFFGSGVRAGRYYNECSPSDIAPTIAAMLGVEPPSGSVGRVLVEAIASNNQRADAGNR
ncbi:MAG TPA: alkaline phosphatase family protein [Blastocatellia bacterium]|nr:alkaline phosphatase family protein [Blastocatellia bacterium]